MALLSGPALLVVQQGNGGPPDPPPSGVPALTDGKGPRSSGEDPLLCLWVEAIEGEVGVTDQSREHLDTANTAGITMRNQRICSHPFHAPGRLLCRPARLRR